jgi:hypothetical protein
LAAVCRPAAGTVIIEARGSPANIDRLRTGLPTRFRFSAW